MTVLVDEARWEWRGLRWAHLVSDESYEELHDFARRLGKRRLGFQGDHYDVDEHDRARAIGFGATTVTSRELVRRLRAAGLRDRTSKPRWEQLGHWDVGVEITGLDRLVRVQVHQLGLDTRAVRAALFADTREFVLLLDLPPGTAVEVDAPATVVAGAPRSNGWSSIEIFVSR